ncbi:hypothetical protein NDU88_000439 [Pleurodeles waltl]|uniref:Uncharacterized protein n=1 Tax=Pleurodeles waltl TaxID=8319 RepID=A0AAV7P2U8_PLEWA|nr:hypothetical protein NDU88_000439 [Pleurodeles waltl]
MAIGMRLEGRDTKFLDLTAESWSILNDIAGFQDKLTGMEPHRSLIEAKLNSMPNGDQELQYLLEKDRSCRDNIHFFEFPERAKCTDVKAFLVDTLPTLTSLTFFPPLELQCAHRMGLCLKVMVINCALSLLVSSTMNMYDS